MRAAGKDSAGEVWRLRRALTPLATVERRQRARIKVEAITDSHRPTHEACA